MLEQGGEHLWQWCLARAIRIARFLKGRLVDALRPNDPDAFRSFLAEGIQELGATEVEELLLVWLGWFLALVRAVQTEARFHPSSTHAGPPQARDPFSSNSQWMLCRDRDSCC